MAITIQNQYKTVPFNMGLLNPYVLPPFYLRADKICVVPETHPDTSH
jgi:hypothetical protein